MGFMDKVKAQATVLADKAQAGVQQGQTKIQDMQSGKQADHLLRELGAYVFLSERGRIQPESEAKVAAIMDQLDTLETTGAAVTITPDPYAVPAAGAVPQAGAPVPQAGAPVPPPPESAAPSAGSAIPQSGGGLPPAGGAIPQSGGGLPGQ